jgi:GH24 family phage-related lysozyme (muramidase)
MPTIIDRLVLLLDLDARGLKNGQKQVGAEQEKLRRAGEKTGKEFVERTKKTTEGFAKLRNEIISLFAVFTAGAGLKQFVQDTIATDAATGRLAKNLGITTESLSAWQGVLRRSGGTAQDANAGLQSLVSAFEQIDLTGQSPLIPYLNALHLTLADLQDPSESLLKIADAFQKMDPRQAAAFGQGMGLSPSMISLLERGRSAVAGMLADQKQLGGTTAESAAAAQRLQDALSQVTQAVSNLGRKILVSLTPAIAMTARGITMIAEFASKHKPTIIGLFMGIATAALVALAPITALVVEALLLAAPFILAGVAVGALIELFPVLARWITNLVQTNALLNAAWQELSAAADELGSAISDALKPLQPLFDGLAKSAKEIGEAIASAFGKVATASVEGFVRLLLSSIRGLAGALRALSFLARGDFAGAAKAWAEGMSGAQDAWTVPSSDLMKPKAAPSAGARPASQSPGQSAASSASQQAVDMIKRFEGYTDRAKYDRNAFRAGYGSDTVTDPTTGQVSRVTSGTTVDRRGAEADLLRRVNSEFLPRTAAAVGASWARLNDTTKAALTSVAYNYGHLPRAVLNAARAGDDQGVAAAIRGLATAKGVNNPERRYAEAAAIGAATVAPGSRYATPTSALGNLTAVSPLALPSNDNRAAIAAMAKGDTRISIGNITVHTQATDARGIARELGPALRQEAAVTQASTGLG